jgi:hypothetical protein
MDEALEDLLRQANRNNGIPVIVICEITKPGAWLVMPYWPDGSKWLQEGHSRHNHHYVRDPRPGHWVIPKAWVSELSQRLVALFRQCYLVQGLCKTEQCAPACWDAAGLECVCSCMGMNHGNGRPEGRWYEISETCAISWGAETLHYKLMAKQDKRDEADRA